MKKRILIKMIHHYFGFEKSFLFVLVPVFLFILIGLWLLGYLEQKHLYNVLLLFFSFLLSVLAALVWHYFFTKGREWEKKKPLFELWPYTLTNTNNDNLYIIVASLPVKSGVENIAPGTGEALALSMILSALQKINYPSNKIIINYSDDYKDDEANPQFEKIKNLIENNNVIILGGPKYNIITEYIFSNHTHRITYIFSRWKDNPNKLKELQQTGYNNVVAEDYSGLMVLANDKSYIVGEPKPLRITPDNELKKDCGMILRLVNGQGKLTTLIAGGRTAGVWLAAQLMTDQNLIDDFLKQPKFECIENEDFQIICECELNNVFFPNLSEFKIKGCYPPIRKPLIFKKT